MQADDVNPYAGPNSEPTPVEVYHGSQATIPMPLYLATICALLGTGLIVLLIVSLVCSGGTWPDRTRFNVCAVLVIIFTSVYLTVYKVQRVEADAIRDSELTVAQNTILIFALFGSVAFLVWYFIEFIAMLET